LAANSYLISEAIRHQEHRQDGSKLWFLGAGWSLPGLDAEEGL